MSWNIQHACRPDGRVDVGALESAASSLGADVLALQEVDRGVGRSNHVDQAAAAAVATGMDCVFSASISFPSGGSYGNALLVRGTIGTWRAWRLPRLPGSEPRSAIVADVETGSGPLTVVTTHLSIRSPEAWWQLRRLVVAAVGASARSGQPLLILGDLNLGPAIVSSAARRWGLTWAPVQPTFPAHAPSRSIDHALLGRPLAVAEVESARLAVSDHLALVVRFDRRR